MRPRLVIVPAVAALVSASAAQAGAAVFYTDADGGPRIEPVFVDGNANVRSGPFRDWRGWGSRRARATSPPGSVRTTVVMRAIRECDGRRQYREHRVITREGGRRVGKVQRFVNPACADN